MSEYEEGLYLFSSWGHAKSFIPEICYECGSKKIKPTRIMIWQRFYFWKSFNDQTGRYQVQFVIDYDKEAIEYNVLEKNNVGTWNHRYKGIDYFT